MERLTKIDGIGLNECIKCFDCNSDIAGENLEHCGVASRGPRLSEAKTGCEQWPRSGQPHTAVLPQAKWRRMPTSCGYCEHWQAVLDRLAAYEDTGLAPEDFKKAFNEDAILNLAGQTLGVTQDCLREFAAGKASETGG